MLPDDAQSGTVLCGARQELVAHCGEPYTTDLVSKALHNFDKPSLFS